MSIPEPRKAPAPTGTDQSEQVMSIIHRGSTPVQVDHGLLTSVYLRAIQSSTVTLTDLRDAGPLGEVQRCLMVLAASRLVNQIDDATWSTTPPSQSLTEVAARMERDAQTLRAATPALSRLHEQAHELTSPGQKLATVELLTSLGQVSAAMDRLFAEANSQVYAMRTRSARVLQVLRMDPEQVRAPLMNRSGGVVRCRVAFDAVLMKETTRMHEFVSARVASGDQIRFSTNVPFTVTTSDTGMTVLDVEDAAGCASGLLITQPALSRAMRQLIEDTWNRGARWTGSGGLVAAEPLDQRDRDILAHMLTGATDGAIARQLQISLRTVERRVSRLLDLLGAGTRFQAGALAAKRGWI